LGFGVWGLGFGVWGLGFVVWGLWFGVVVWGCGLSLLFIFCGTCFDVGSVQFALYVYLPQSLARYNRVENPLCNV